MEEVSREEIEKSIRMMEALRDEAQKSLDEGHSFMFRNEIKSWVPYKENKNKGVASRAAYMVAKCDKEIQIAKRRLN